MHWFWQYTTIIPGIVYDTQAHLMYNDISQMMQWKNIFAWVISPKKKLQKSHETQKECN